MSNFNNLNINTSLEIKVLGTGCSKCKTLEKLVNQVVSEQNMDATVTKVEDIIEIMNYDILSTPALVVNDKVVISGKLPTMNEIKKILAE